MRKRKTYLKAKVATSIAIASNHGLLREGLNVMLGSFCEFEVVSEVANGLDLLKTMAKKPIDVVLMECELPGLSGVETLMRVKNEFPETKVLLLSTWNNTECINKFIQHGCNGMLLGAYNFDMLLKAIKAIRKNKFYCNERQRGPTIAKIRRQKPVQPLYNRNLLTAREKEVVALICKEKSNQEISKELFLSMRTVERHRENILLKTGSRKSIGLAIYAVKNGIV